ncbi:MAG TPA: hypothetical protein VMS22_21370 [Candidatus Eisenbacteria bacterium]|nr:hypothetical protein [Candidatus Eisenbacteria bacterium]
MKRSYVEPEDRYFDLRNVEPITVLPEQLYDRSAATTGEQRLLIAILDDAIRVYRRIDCPGLTMHERCEIRAAAAWLNADDPTWPFSFVNVCHALSLDPVAIREAVRRQRRRAAVHPIVRMRERGATPLRLAVRG